MFTNNLDEFGNVARDKAIFMGRACNKEERIKYDETFGPITRLEAIKIFLTFTSSIGMK